MSANWCSASTCFEARAFIKSVHDSLAADEVFADICRRCLVELRSVCGTALSGPEHVVAPFDWTPDVVLNSFGSTTQGTALQSSDLDVRMTFEQFAVREPDRMLHYLKAVAKHISERPSASALQVVRMVDSHRLPVLRLHFEGRLDVDLTMGEEFEGGAQLDHDVRVLLDAAPCDGARRVVRLVKAFAKNQGFVDAYGGYLNSLSWVFLAIGFLQNEGCLPPLRDLEDVDGDGDGFKYSKGPRRALWPVQPTPATLARFLDFLDDSVSDLPQRVSIWSGKRWRTRPYSWSGAPAHRLYVENPHRRDINVASCLRSCCWDEILASAASCRRLLRVAPCSLDTSATRRLFESRMTESAPQAEDHPPSKRRRRGV